MTNESSKKPIIAVDIDNVPGDEAGAVTKFFKEKKGIVRTAEQFNENYAVMVGVSDEQAREYEHEFSMSDYGARNYKSFPSALETLKKLKSDFKLVILSSRSSYLRTITLEWIEKNFPNVFDEIYLLGFYDNDEELHVSSKRTKADKLREIGAEFLIDDQPKHVNSFAEIGGKSLLFGDFGWNRDVEVVDGVTRVTNWAAIADYFAGRM